MRSAIIADGIVINIIKGQIADSVPCGNEVGIGWLYNGEEFTAPPQPEPPAPTSEELIDAINAERDRRLAAGFDYDFGDARGVHRINTTDADMQGWDEVTKMAQTALNLGHPDTAINIKTGTGRVTVTAAEWQMILLASGQHRQPIFNAAFDLRTMEPIPDDYAKDTQWQ